MAGGAEAELLRDLSFSPRLVASALHRAIHTYLIGDQLTVVLVGGDHQHLTPCTRGQDAQRADDVVGLEVGHFDRWDTVGSEELVDEGDGDADAFGSLLTLCLIGRIFAVAEGTARGVEDDSDLVGLLLREEVFEHQNEAEDSTGIAPLAIEAWGFDERIVSSINQGISIEEEESLSHMSGDTGA